MKPSGREEEKAVVYIVEDGAAHGYIYLRGIPV